MSPSVWTVALAAGAGTRLSALTGGIPKQFWRRPTGATLLENTLLRLRAVAPPERTVVIAASQHRHYLEGIRTSLADTHVVLQPRDRGTAAGIALALIPVLETDPDAIVVISPSDHGVRDERAFQQGLQHAIGHVDSSGDVVLCGVESTGAAQDYGWIMPGAARGANDVRSVVAFVEKPEAQVASALYRVGAVWNTMVIVARARTLLDLYRRYLPSLAGVFVQALRVSPAAREAWIEAAYEGLESMDFSRDLLTVAKGLCTVVWPAAMGWSDLGTPERMKRWDLGTEPAQREAPRPLPGTPARQPGSRYSNPRGSVLIGSHGIA